MFNRTPQWFACLLAAAIALGTGPALARSSTIELTVPKVTIYPGDVIASELLTVKVFRAGKEQLPLIRRPETAIGKVARRTLVAGKPIPVSYIREAQLVKQGKPVRIVFAEGPMVISGVAIPLQSGTAGSIISLRNIDSGTVIKGTVGEDGTVRIVGP